MYKYYILIAYKIIAQGDQNFSKAYTLRHQDNMLTADTMCSTLAFWGYIVRISACLLICFELVRVFCPVYR